MKLLIIIAISLNLFVVIPAFSQWQVVSSGTTSDLVDGLFITDSTGFIISHDGLILKTTNGGTSWVIKANLYGTLNAICNGGQDTLYVGGSKLYRSTDAGNNWVYVSDFPGTITQLGFLGSQNGYAMLPGYYTCTWAGYNYNMDGFEIYKSTNHGGSWMPAFPVHDSKSQMQFINDTVAYFTGYQYLNYPHCYQGGINMSRKTMNDGITWNDFQPPTIGTQFSFFSNDSGYFFKPWDHFHPEYKNNLWKTSNRASTFDLKYTEIPDSSTIQCLFINSVQGFLRADHNIFYTGSEGLQWKNEYYTPETLMNIFYTPSHFLFGVGLNGLIVWKKFMPDFRIQPVRRISVDSSSIDFGFVPVGFSSTKTISVINTGNVTLHLTLYTSSPFSISLDGNFYSTQINLPITPFQSSTIYVKFTPGAPQNYHDIVSFMGDSIQPLSVSLSGIGQAGLAGVITQDTLICSTPLLVFGDVIVNPGVRMTICAGTVLIFTGNYKLDIRGELRAEGKAASLIQFITPATISSWNGIRIDNTDQQDTTVMRFCASNDPSDGSLITILNGNVTVDHCQFDNIHSQIDASGLTTNLLIMNTELSNMVGNGSEYGVGCNQCGRVFLSDVKIHGNRVGAYILGGKKGSVISGSEFYNNDDEGIYSNGSSAITRNKIHANGAGLFFSGQATVIDSNEIYQNKTTGITIPFCDSSCLVRHNKIYSNTHGGIVFTGNSSLFENNEIFENGNTGLSVEAGNNGSTIRQNLIYNNALNYSTDYKGAGIRLTTKSNFHPTVNLVSNSICNNYYITFGTDIFAYTSDSTATLNILFANNIIYNQLNTNSNVICWPGVNTTYEANCINQTGLPGGFNINANPGLKDIEGHDLTLSDTSVCINSGDTLHIDLQAIKDFAGNPRIYGKRSDIGAYELQKTLNIDKKKESQFITVYPNPTEGKINVIVDSYEPCKISISDFLGRRIMEKSFIHSTTLNLSNTRERVYFYEVEEAASTPLFGKILIK